MRQAGGHIWLYSEPGIGSSFKLYFPRVDAPAPAQIDIPPVATPAGNGHLLVVEDELVVREMTTKVLHRLGYDVTVAASGAEAREMLLAGGVQIDVLVSDVVMPGGVSGIDLAEFVFDRYPRAGAVLLSGYTADILDLERLIKRGVIFLAKPVPTHELLAAVARAAEHRRDLEAAR